ncbi:sugar MFS transporter [Psychrosphaera sp. 1_MG-2023]|uniref:sugar MFS transporter n=1 Tax=Psychrosphaera sp. 1_MG-2023 TaxID=3062643 RepID=UPI0026E116E4|nr:sugar MFS transporter [Psychrosphaera sp. 1_MG-2023]MDO6718159.1 sugar MFS transporter [Psychrosphaera sp. 1_MG-2023]
MTSISTTQPATDAKSNFMPMVIIGVLFFIFGFVTWLNGSLIPFLKIICELNEFQALLVTFAFYIAYTVMAFPMSLLLDKTGYKNGMALGLAVMVVGALLFIPAAKTGHYFVFLTALFVLGSGLTILQTASNPYVVKIGPESSAAMRISIMGLINKAAGVLAPMLFTALVLSGMGDYSETHIASLDAASRAAKIDELSNALIVPYIGMAIALSLLVAFVKFSNLPELELEDDAEDDSAHNIMSFPHTVLGAVAIFFYVGIEVIAGDTIGLYGQALNVENFASLTSYTMVFMVIGYVIGATCIPRYISQQQALLGSAIAGMLCLVGVLTASVESHAISSVLWGWSGIATIPDSVTFVAMLGLAHALVWPAVWPLALNGLGKYTAQGSALMIMGIAGGAILPLAFGQIAHVTEETSLGYLVGFICYGYLLYYGLIGHKKRSW